MSTPVPDDQDWYPKLSTGQAHSVSEKPTRKKKHPIGFVPPKPRKKNARP